MQHLKAFIGCVHVHNQCAAAHHLTDHKMLTTTSALAYDFFNCLSAFVCCARLSGCTADTTLVLTEKQLLGEGAFSRVSEVEEESTKRCFALKRMTKTAALQCPEHVYCEQHISKNTANGFCIRQYASFKDQHHLYFLFDLMSGGDLMDVLVAEAKIIKHTVPQVGAAEEGLPWDSCRAGMGGWAGLAA
jgi:hypothetical protein